MNLMNWNTDFLKDLKAGDKVICCHWGHFNRQEYVTTVEKITPKGFIKVDGILFHSITGRARGENYYHLEQATDERIKEITEKNYVKTTLYMMQNDIKDLTYEQAKAICEILNLDTEAAE